MMKLALLLVFACAVQDLEAIRQKRSTELSDLCKDEEGNYISNLGMENPNDCNSFYQCSNGYLFTMPCPPGLVYNAAKNYCDWPANVPKCDPNAGEIKIICEHDTDKVKCPKGQRIRVLEAFYGRDDGETCPGPIKTTSCSSDISGKLIASKCEGRRRCKIEASNGVFGDPCVGTFKYVKVRYFCAEQTSVESDDYEDVVEKSSTE